MMTRLFFALFVLLVAAAGGYWLFGMSGILWATNTALLALLVRDYFWGHKLEVWLRKGEPLAVIELSGFWGELVDRVRRGFKSRTQLA